MRMSKGEKALVGAGCLYGILSLAFWVTAIYVVAHFVLKFW